jgi:hypothetical protein
MPLDSRIIDQNVNALHFTINGREALRYRLVRIDIHGEDGHRQSFLGHLFGKLRSKGRIPHGSVHFMTRPTEL